MTQQQEPLTGRLPSSSSLRNLSPPEIVDGWRLFQDRQQSPTARDHLPVPASGIQPNQLLPAVWPRKANECSKTGHKRGYTVPRQVESFFSSMSIFCDDKFESIQDNE